MKDYHFEKLSIGLCREQELILAPYIINLVGQYFNAAAGYELTKLRDKVSVHHKYVCMYLIKTNTEHLSLKTIGEYFLKDHCMIIHACKRIKNYLFYDTEVKDQIFAIQGKINSKVEKLIDGIFDEKADEEYYKINLNFFTSIKVHGCNKFIIGVNITDAELDSIKGLFDTIETRKHKNTGLILCEPKTTKEYDGKYKGEKAEGENSRKQNKRNVNCDGNDTTRTC